jgi:hypothetical protein
LKAQGIFLGSLIVLVIVNILYSMSQPSGIWTMTIGAISGFIALIVGGGVLLGINVFGTGLTGASVKIAFGMASLLNLMFQIEILGYPVGMGLLNTLFDVFAVGDFYLIGFIISVVMMLSILGSGIIIIIGGGD